MAFREFTLLGGLPGKTVTRKQYLNSIILHIQCHCAPSVNRKRKQTIIWLQSCTPLNIFIFNIKKYFPIDF